MENLTASMSSVLGSKQPLNEMPASTAGRYVTELVASNETTVGFQTLYPALVQVFGIIALGYLAGR